MHTLPSARTTLASQSPTAPVATDLIHVIGAVPQNADGVPRLFSNVAALLAFHGYAETAEYPALHMEGAGKAVLFAGLPIATPGHIGRTESLHTGTALVTAAVGSDGALAEVKGRVSVLRGGTVGTSQILLSVSLDDGASYKTARLGTALTYTIPYIGVTLTLESGGTLVTGDEIFVFETTAPAFDSTGVTLAKTKMEAGQYITRTWLFVGDQSTLAGAQAIEGAADAYETETERFIVAKAQVRDRRVVKASRPRCALVPATNAQIVFAEVGATGDTITRSSGSFVSDGFQVGDYIRVTGSLSNNVSGKITAVSATVLTLDTTDLAAETLASGGAITGAPSIVFATTTITRNRGSWVTDGFAVGDVVTIAGSTSNDGTAIITTLSATVMTCAASSFVSETNGMDVVTFSFEESETAWASDIDGDFAAVVSKRIDLGAGRLAKISPITGYKMRRPVQWADSVRAYSHDLHLATWEKDIGPLDGWDIAGEHDERVNETLLAGRFTCARTWGNGPTGAFIAMSVTRTDPDNILSLTHNMCVANLVQAVVQRETENFVGKTPVLNPPDDTGKKTLATPERTRFNTRVNSALQRNVGSPEGARWSGATFAVSTDDDLGVADATLTHSTALDFNGTIVHVSGSVGVT
jgi:hypothetical protein